MIFLQEKHQKEEIAKVAQLTHQMSQELQEMRAELNAHSDDKTMLQAVLIENSENPDVGFNGVCPFVFWR